MSHIKDRLIQLKNEVENTGNGAYFSKNNISKIVELLLADLEQDEKENGWIPVSERLPEIKMDYKECYLVTDGRFCWMAYYTSEKEWIFADCTNCKNKIDWTDVIAWMPLPNPMKEDVSTDVMIWTVMNMRRSVKIMRLIDADKTYKELIDSIEWLREQDYEAYSAVGDDIRTILDKQPTVFDVDKVVEQLEKRSILERPVGWTKSYEIVILDDAVEIVKGGVK